jgi:hypothetical protein
VVSLRTLDKMATATATATATASVESVAAVAATAAKHYLSKRANWQAAGGAAAKKIEEEVELMIGEILETYAPGKFTVEKHPEDLRQIYYQYDYQQNPDLYKKPAAPGPDDVWYEESNGKFWVLKGKKQTLAWCGGCIPDIKIHCKTTDRSYFIEVKRQNDAGNAHERCAKYATPSILRLIQANAGKDVAYHPIGYLFTGGLTEKRKYQVELRATFGFAADHLLFWKGVEDPEQLGQWILKTVVPLLE